MFFIFTFHNGVRSGIIKRCLQKTAYPQTTIFRSIKTLVWNFLGPKATTNRIMSPTGRTPLKGKEHSILWLEDKKDNFFDRRKATNTGSDVTEFAHP